MIDKPLQKSIELLQLEALLRRLDPSHSKYQLVSEEYAKKMAGYRGLQATEYYISFLEEKDYRILYDIRLSLGKYFFQMDLLILTPTCILISEVKNFKGDVYFDNKFSQFIRVVNDREESYANPLNQVLRQQQRLTTFLDNHHIEPLPIDHLVVFSQPSTKIKSNLHHFETEQRIGHAEGLIDMIKYVQKQHANPIPKQILNKISRLLKKNHEEKYINVFKQFGLEKSDIKNKSQCLNCEALSMIRLPRRWYCLECHTYSSDAHIQAIRDYFLLIKLTITIQECCDFLQLSSPYIARRLLQSLNLPTNGQTKSTAYVATEEFLRE